MTYNIGPSGPVGPGEVPTFRDGRAGTFQHTSATRWEEHHGWGSLRPDGSGNIDFNDTTSSGPHSHYNYRPGVGRMGGRNEGEPHGSWTNYSTPK